IDWIGYFTAYITPRPSDPEQPRRQRAYLEALKTLPCLEVIPGHFLEVEKSGILLSSQNTNVVKFKTFEEKGSDVNLACRLVLHGARGAFDQAIVVTNDGDLREPIKIVVHELGLPVHIISPDVTINGTLRNVATSASSLDTRMLRHCLFPPTLVNADGVAISRPPTWA
ncbi:MAG: NYN domain-containing protein, partial [Thermomicrobiales bacterium]|nr:NYN domain-containing protein [Thermomicrobiales bacterium]